MTSKWAEMPQNQRFHEKSTPQKIRKYPAKMRKNPQKCANQDFLTVAFLGIQKFMPIQKHLSQNLGENERSGVMMRLEWILMGG